MGRDFYPQAVRVPGRSAGSYTGGEWKILLHDTEGSSAAGAIGAYRATGSWPHLTVAVEGGRFKVYQHIPFSQAGRALERPAGAGDTNRNRNIQIEITGFCTKGYSDTMYDGLADLIDWLCEEFKIPKRATFEFTRCLRPTRRLTWGEWNRYSGILGHQHVPFNHHTDPGIINVDRLLGGHKYGSRSLKVGMFGADVRELQQHLNKRLKARRLPQIDADGEYGARTERSVDTVQYHLGFPISVYRGDGASKRTQQFIKDPTKRPAKYRQTAVERRKRDKALARRKPEAKH